MQRLQFRLRDEFPGDYRRHIYFTYNFCSQAACAGGMSPTGFIQATIGEFYGTTGGGGTGPGVSGSFPGCATISSSGGLPSFVEALPASGPAGTQIEILGSNLSETTSVTFGGVVATSPWDIRATLFWLVCPPARHRGGWK